MTTDQLPWDLTSIREITRLKPEMTAEQIGRHVVDSATGDQIRELFVNHIAGLVDAIRRSDTRDVEKAATKPVEQSTVNPYATFEKWLADPSKHWHLPNHRARVAFREWAGDRFDAWQAAARTAAEAAQDTNEHAVEMFEGDWHPGGVMAYERERRHERLQAYMTAVIESVSRDVRLETTRELLESVFALGDGQKVTWGAATVEDHKTRIELLARNAAGVVDTAARHQAAIRMIEQAGVSCLADLASAEQDAPGSP